ncbi:unnamed protein product [Mytilus coruscus]|uniref:IRG-type G domain-containing protein n=1 Tax=Mytilus coruscus TaxID=42192 RepID=A0A6J8AKY7_MYTCO|nr:unnamed protein product [Mytilus coruscus]
MNRQETICSGIKDGKRCPKLISNKAVFCLDCESLNTDNVPVDSLCESDNKSTGESDSSENHDDDNGNEKWDFNEQLNISHESNVSTNSSVKKRCKNCGHTIQKDQMFCDKCGNKLGAVCIGEINGKPCSKFISVKTKFCAHCGTANIENSSGKKRDRLKRNCKSCGHDIHKLQKFCNNCGYKIGALCIGKIQGNICNEFLNVEIKFCANCGKENPDYITAQCQEQCGEPDNSLPPNESVMTLTSMGFTREQAIDALKNTGDNVEVAIHRILGLPVYENRRTRRKINHSAGDHVEIAVDWLLNLPTDDETMTRTETVLSEANFKDLKSLIPSNESSMELTSVEFTGTIPIDALKLVDGDEEKAENKFRNLRVGDDTMLRKTPIMFEEEIKDSDEERPDQISSSDLSSEENNMEIESKGSIINDILNRLKTDGAIATRQYLTEQVTKWKRAKVKIAVAGQSTAGKSAFINAIRGVVFTDEGYAKEGFGDTTLNIEEYVHPNNKQIIYCDLPGYGTTTITRDTFLEKVIISEYDMFIIFFTRVPTTDDEWLVRMLQKNKIPVCFVRTKLDQDIENGKKMGKNANTVLADIKDTIARATESMPVLKDEQIFIISNHKPYVGDMSQLVNFMQERVTKIKCEAILLSIPAFTEEIIENKYQDLLKRMPFITVLHALLADPLMNKPPTIIDEIRMYFRVFELDTDYATDVPGLKHYFDDKYVFKLMDDLTEKMPSFGVQLIPIYSTIQTYKVCKKYLTNLLDELKIDAHTMYMHITKNV